MVLNIHYSWWPSMRDHRDGMEDPLTLMRAWWNSMCGAEQCIEAMKHCPGSYNIGGIWSIHFTFLRHFHSHMMYNSTIKLIRCFTSPEHQGLKQSDSPNHTSVEGLIGYSWNILQTTCMLPLYRIHLNLVNWVFWIIQVSHQFQTCIPNIFALLIWHGVLILFRHCWTTPDG